MIKHPLEYAVLACERLEQDMLTLGWPADAAHFRQRAQIHRRALAKLGVGTACPQKEEL